jgi:gamma-glutamyl phosphate reductase
MISAMLLEIPNIAEN